MLTSIAKLMQRKNTGFTLIELAIVLGVVGVMTIGLWRLLSNSNQQTRDQAAANQQTLMINAIKQFFSSAQGTAALTAMAAGANLAVPLPSAANPAGSAGCTTSNAAMISFASGAGDTGLCSLLQAGTSSSTTNSYGQTYSVWVLKDGTAAGTAPNSYSFMIFASGGSFISDLDGGRISTLIGNEGGFIYSAAVCGATPATACGAYSGWSVAVSKYTGATGTAGSIASLSTVYSSQNSTLSWLARYTMPSDVGSNTPQYNTMQPGVNLFIGGNTLFLGKDKTLTTGGGVFDMQAGTMNMHAGTINMNAGTVNMNGGTITGQDNSTVQITYAATPVNPVVNVSSPCSRYSTAGCPNTMQIGGDLSVGTGALWANTLVLGSDLRLKTNIQPLQHSLDDVVKLRPVSFNFKAGGAASMGVIAQELEQVYPQLVKDDGDTKYVNYNGLFGPLIGAIQDLKQENDTLRKELDQQKAQINKLQKETKYGRGAATN